MFYKNAWIYCCDHTFRMGAFEVTEDGRFGAVADENIPVPADAVDLQGATVIPGLVDVHIHGAMGADFSDGDLDGLKKMAAYLASQGITSFAPASMTLPYETLSKAYACAAEFAKEQPACCARLMGIHMEGPYFSEKKKGAQNGAYLKDPDFAGFKASKLCTVSVAHTDAGYEDVKAAYDAGATHLTHLYNAMPGIHHRNPGVIPAAAENPNVRAELICDGLHVHPASVRLAYSIFGEERLVLISDALRCSGMPDGDYELGGQTVHLAGGIAKLADGTIAGAATNLFDGMKNAIKFGIPEEDAIRAVTYNPACAIGKQTEIGVIGAGRFADFIVCSADYSQKRVFLGGKEI